MKLNLTICRSVLILSLVLAFSCQATKDTQDNSTSNIVEIIFLQMNDVYEIAPLEGGRVGGLARVATLRQQLLAENPNTYTVLAGDFLNPSLLSSMKMDGKKIAGKHMVEVLNTLGLDLATFGNHEFDLKFHDLQERINESAFDWVSSNVYNLKGDYFKPFEKETDSLVIPIPRTMLLHFTNKSGQIATVGIFAVTLPFNKAGYVMYDDVFTEAQYAYDDLKDTADLIVGLTHLDMDDDHNLALRIPGIHLIMGGHDHTNMYYRAGETYIAKADANAKSVYIHRVHINLASGSVDISSELVNINEDMKDEIRTAEVVDKWSAIADANSRSQGFDPDEVLMVLGDKVLDGREVTIRNQPSELCQLIARAISFACPESDLAILNSGSVRLDDLLAGEVTQYDILRTLPFGGAVVEADMKGSLLNKFLQTGWDNQGIGGYLQWDRVRSDSRRNQWFIDNQLLDTTRYYRVATTAFLMKGLESNLDFLVPENPLIKAMYYPKPEDPDDVRHDIRNTLIHYLRFGGK